MVVDSGPLKLKLIAETFGKLSSKKESRHNVELSGATSRLQTDLRRVELSVKFSMIDF
jgi:hypothetical protein